MDYQPMNQSTDEGSVPPMPSMYESAAVAAAAPAKSMTKLYVALGGVVLLSLGVLVVWYLMPPAVPTVPVAEQQQVQQTSAVAETQLAPLTSGNTTANISADLSQIPDDSAALTQDQNSLNQSIQGL